MLTQHRPVVVGIDGSDSALQAVGWGAAEANRHRVGLRLVIAFERTRADVAGEGFGKVLLDRARQQLAVAAAVAEREAPDVDLEQLLVVGHPLSVLSARCVRRVAPRIGQPRCDQPCPLCRRCRATGRGCGRDRRGRPRTVSTVAAEVGRDGSGRIRGRNAG